MEINYKKVGYKICEVLYWVLFALYLYFVFADLLIDEKFNILINGIAKTFGIYFRILLALMIFLLILSLFFKDRVKSLVVLLAYQPIAIAIFIIFQGKVAC